MMYKVWYICDPDKNTECRKTRCHNSQDDPQGWCDATSNPAYAKTGSDGRPLVAYVQNDGGDIYTDPGDLFKAV